MLQSCVMYMCPCGSDVASNVSADLGSGSADGSELYSEKCASPHRSGPLELVEAAVQSAPPSGCQHG